jgi:hypothetical protein
MMRCKAIMKLKSCDPFGSEGDFFLNIEIAALFLTIVDVEHMQAK